MSAPNRSPKAGGPKRRLYHGISIEARKARKAARHARRAAVFAARRRDGHNRAYWKRWARRAAKHITVR